MRLFVIYYRVSTDNRGNRFPNRFADTLRPTCRANPEYGDLQVYLYLNVTSRGYVRRDYVNYKEDAEAFSRRSCVG